MITAMFAGSTLVGQTANMIARERSPLDIDDFLALE